MNATVGSTVRSVACYNGVPCLVNNVHHLFAVVLDISIQLGSIGFHLEFRFMFPFKMFINIFHPDVIVKASFLNLDI